MTRILAIADEESEALYGDALYELRPDLILSCGDLSFDYLENLVTRAAVPLLYVPGNHDPDLTYRPNTYGPLVVETPIPGPGGCDNVDGRILDVAGLRIAGLGGSIRYREGPNQYSQRRMRRRAWALELRARWKKLRDGRSVDVFLTHSPPLALGDGEDPAHRGFAAFRHLVAALQPKLMLHGHLHPYGRHRADQRLGETKVMNAVPYRFLDL